VTQIVGLEGVVEQLTWLRRLRLMRRLQQLQGQKVLTWLWQLRCQRAVTRLRQLWQLRQLRGRKVLTWSR
jgi:hypothetical protein